MCCHVTHDQYAQQAYLDCRSLERLMNVHQQPSYWANMHNALCELNWRYTEDPEATFNSLEAVRNMSAPALAQYVDSDRSRQFSWPVYWKAFKTSALHNFACKWLEIDNAQSPSFR